MSDMHSKIKNDIKEAMKGKDVIKRDCLKNVLGKAQDAAKAKNGNTDSIPDDMIINAVQKEVKQLNQTIDALKGCEDTDLYKVSGIQIEILKGYLPKQMDQKEVEEAVAWILSKGEYRNFGDKMKVVMKELRGKADSKMIRDAVEAYK